MTRRVALAVVAGLAILAVSTACTNAPGGSATPTTPAKSATDILKEAAEKSAAQNFAFQISYGTVVSGHGTRDAAGENGQATMKVVEPTSGLAVSADVLAVGTDIYLKLDFGPVTSSIPGLAGVADKWMHISKTKLSASGIGASLNPVGEATTPKGILTGIVSAEQVSDTEFKGTLDLATAVLPGGAAINLAGLAADAKKVPFGATLDGDGRISKIVVNMPAVGTIPATELAVTYFEYGAAVNVAKPSASETVEAPEMIYQFL